MKKTIGIFAHVDGGKTTFSEQLLYHTKSIRTRGRVDHKDAYLDSNKIERDRGITVFSDIGIFKYKDSEYYLIDTPGHVDFSSEMERAISILDYAILIVSSTCGIQGHTETIWNLLRKNNIPTFIFINKIDVIGSDFNRTFEDLRNNLSKDIIYLDKINNELNEENIEFIAERDDDLLNIYLDKGYNSKLWIISLKKLIKENKIFPCFKGSALLDDGIEEFLENFDLLTFTEFNYNKDFKGRVFKIKYDEKGNRITFIKCLAGSLKVKDILKFNVNNKEITEKVNGIRVYNGEKFKALDKVSSGDVFGVLGIESLKAGMGIGVEDNFSYEMTPTLKAKVIYDEKINPKDVLNIFKILESEDESLNVSWNETLKEIHISIMGKIQLEVLKEIINDRFNLEVEFGVPEILYKETIEGEILCGGHFEPLGHYAEVYLKLEENKRNTGIEFINKCSKDDLTSGNQNLIKTHIFEKEHNGILTGSPVTDLKITLITGRSHNKHTSGGDFREATKRALRQGLEQGKSRLLEPYYKFKISVKGDLIGRVLSDIQKMSGSFYDPINNGDNVIINGRGPVSEFINYGIEFVSFTKGKGSLSFNFDGYDFCHNEEEVIERKKYNKDSDIEYTSTSIFCSKGQSYLVKGEDVMDYLHCLK